MTKLAIGVDIGGTNSVVALVSEGGDIVRQQSFSTAAHLDFQSYVEELSTVIKQVKGEDTILGIGLGAPNVNCHSGNIEKAPNIVWGENAPLRSAVEQCFPGITVSVVNDANAAALGEMCFGGAKGMKDFVEITLGTGLGSGFVCGGQLLVGASGYAGELGHIIVKPEGRLCGCGRHGCLETYVSATGITRTMAELDPTRADMSSKDIFLAAKAGDPVALKAFEFTGEVLGNALADVVAISSPESFFLFGGLALAGDLIFEPTIRSFNKRLMPIFRGSVKILPSELEGATAALLGAAAQILTLARVG